MANWLLYTKNVPLKEKSFFYIQAFTFSCSHDAVYVTVSEYRIFSRCNGSSRRYLFN